MSPVVDANLIAAVVLPLPYSEQATKCVATWKETDVELVSSMLLEYELASVLRKAVVARWLTTDLAVEAMAQVLALDIRCIGPSARLHERALYWAERLEQSKAYDAHYVALAEQVGLELWTADRRLAQGAQTAGVPWVRWIGKA